MMTKKLIIFDCMETLIDMYVIPGDREYALWAYEGSGIEHYWQGFEEFYQSFLEMRKTLKEKEPFHKEYSIQDRYRLMIERKIAREKIEDIPWMIEKLFAQYWPRYRDQCHVQDEVHSTLAVLSKRYKLGVVSNFLVHGGVEELLRTHSIDHYFDFVITSVGCGWRKPHSNIYRAALAESSIAAAENTLFVGDDYLNDFIMPRELGFTAILYDPRERYTHITPRVTRFKELLHHPLLT